MVNESVDKFMNQVENFITKRALNLVTTFSHYCEKINSDVRLITPNDCTNIYDENRIDFLGIFKSNKQAHKIIFKYILKVPLAEKMEYQQIKINPIPIPKNLTKNSRTFGVTSLANWNFINEDLSEIISARECYEKVGLTICDYATIDNNIQQVCAKHLALGKIAPIECYSPLTSRDSCLTQIINEGILLSTSQDTSILLTRSDEITTKTMDFKPGQYFLPATELINQEVLIKCNNKIITRLFYTEGESKNVNITSKTMNLDFSFNSLETKNGSENELSFWSLPGIKQIIRNPKHKNGFLLVEKILTSLILLIIALTLIKNTTKCLLKICRTFTGLAPKKKKSKTGKNY